MNPYRYKSYRYDTETGLYYLQSRYYNPEWGRFINADGLLQTGDGMLDKNMYAYCMNNPIKYLDEDGEAVLIAAIFAVCAIASGIITYATIVQQDKQNGYETNHVDAVARSIINAGTFYSAGPIAASIGDSISSKRNYTRATISSKSVEKVKTVVRPNINITKVNYSNSALKHLPDRPYMNSVLTIQNITKSGNPIREINRSNILRWDVSGSLNGKKGTWELVYDTNNNTIYHFLFNGRK